LTMSNMKKAPSDANVLWHLKGHIILFILSV